MKLKTYMTKIFTVLMLMMISMGAKAEIDIKIEKFTGGEITATQGDEKNGEVVVTLTVAPAEGYTITKDDISVYATISPKETRGDEPEISNKLELDGKDPSDLSEKRDYTVTVKSNFGLWVKEARFKSKDQKGGDPVRTTFPVVTTDTNNPVYYLIQSYQNTGFYMRPYNSNSSVHTLNSLTDEMKWYFLDTDDEGYYYICNKSGKYMYFSKPSGSSSSRTWIELKDLDNSDKDHFKFSVAKNNTKGWDTYNIIPKGNTDKYCLNKQGGNAGSNGVQISNSYDDEASCWNIIALSSYTWTLLPECFKVSDNSNSNRHYYKIKSQNNASYFIKPGTTYVETSNNVDDNMYWYFIEADNNDLTTYYYIIHANTGNYLHYRENKVGNANAIDLSDHTGNETGIDENRFQYIVVRGTNSGESLAKPGGITFNIIPRLFENTSANNIRSISCDKGLGGTLETLQHRYKNTTHWNFEEVEFSTACANPTISYSGTTGKVSISTETAQSAIYYTTDGTEPSSTNGTLYEGPFDVTEPGPITIKAIATKTGFTDSEVTTVTFEQVATPTIQNNGSNAVSITCETEGATIYYTTDGSDPTPSSTPYTGALKDGVSGVTIKAIAVKDGLINSAIGSGSVTLKCDPPVITKGQGVVTITCAFPSTGVSIYYTKNGGDPSSSSSPYTGPIQVSEGDVIKAIAIADGYDNSEVVSKTIVKELVPTDGKYYIKDQSNFTTFLDMVSNTDGASYHYVLQANVTAGQAITQPFTGILEAEADANGTYYKISGLTHALFNTIDGGTVKNVMLDGVIISSGTNVGAIANEMTGTSGKIASIYNCGILSGSVSGSAYVGGIVGQLGDPDNDDNCYARVINCFSYADVSGGSDKGGVVGYNSYASQDGDIRTMVMNCMFYGNISDGVNISPIYGGVLIDNQKTAFGAGLNNYNYYRYESDYSYQNRINKYNNALAAKEEYLNRFEFYRQMLNSNKKLAAYYATGSADNADQKMAKWVLETADRQNNNPNPYPILKSQGTYPSIINYDADHATQLTLVNGKPSEADRKKGGKIGTLTVIISIGSGYPTGAAIKSGKSQITLVRTDKDEDRFNFNYDKVQLPYYNDVGTNNYTGNKVVTGWKITGVTLGSGDDVATQGSFTASDRWGGYNFADRMTYAKDLYSESGRVFSQGAYFDVPYGVESITIEPYWGNAVYVGDANLDLVYDKNYANPTEVADAQFTNGTSTFNEQIIYTTTYNADGSIDKTAIANAIAAKNSSNQTILGGSTVYDNAIVLVGNLHLSSSPSNDKHYTIMSVDEDHDNEPDYSLIYHHSGRANVSPIRFDFLNVMGTAQAQMPREGVKFFNVGIFNPKGWFELTNTTLMYFSQIEYDNGNKAAEPLILLGGIVDQITSNHANSGSGTTTYIHLGSNVRFKQFSNGCHSDRWQFTKHIPVSVTGGDYQEFYLSGMYRPDAVVNADDAECYISSGRFGELAGAGQQMINGNVQWQIYNADIENFYGGGINAANPITGNITVNLYNSHIGTYCGGPKFGNMSRAGSLEYTDYNHSANNPGIISISSDRTVTTEAEGCFFGTYYGAGYGGTSYNRVRTKDNAVVDFPTWQADYTGKRGMYIADNNGIATDFDYDFFVYSTGETGGRFYVKYASLSTAQTNDVNSTLTNCTINGNLYGGGKLGLVVGKATTVLDGCTVLGNVYGAGYSASLEPVKVRDGGFGGNPVKYPSVNTNSGMFEDGEFSGTTEYIWKKHTLSDGESGITTEGGNIIYTNVTLSTLGQVKDAKLTIQGNTTVKMSVYGGGEEAGVDNDTEVIVTGGTIGYENAPVYEDKVGNVYGAGKGLADNVTAGLVKGNTKVTIEGDAESPLIYHNIYGGGAYGSVGTYTYTDNAITGYTSGGRCEVYVKGGHIGIDGHNNGMVFGSSRGDVQAPVNDIDFNDYLAWVHDTKVVIGDEAKGTKQSGDGKFYDYPVIKGSVYGSGENGHTYTNTVVDIHSGMIGIIEIGKKDDERYTSRGNVYGGGCGSDTYDVSGKTYYNLNAGIVLGTTTVNIDGGHVVRNVYGAGSMGSVGTFTLDTDDSNNILDGKPVSSANGTGVCNVNISGGMIGSPGAKMHYDDMETGPDDFGHVFGAGRGETRDSTVYVNLNIVGYVKESHVTVSNKAFITGSVYGGSESGHVLGDTHVTVSGGQIGCGDGQLEPYSDDDWVKTTLAECAHWPYSGAYSPYDKFSGDSGYDSEAAKGGSKKATNGQSFNGNVFGGGSGYYPYAPGKWVRSAGLVEGSTNVLIEGGHILSCVYGGNEHTDVVGSCTVQMEGGTVGVPRTWEEKRGNPVMGNIFGGGKGDKRVLFNTWTNVGSTSVTVSGGTVYGGVFGGGEDGHVLGDAVTTIKERDHTNHPTVIGTLGTTGYDGNVFGGGRGSYTALTAGVVCGNTTVNIEGGLMKGSVYGGGRLASVGTHLVPPTATGNPQKEHPYYGKQISDGKKQDISKYIDNDPNNDEDDDAEDLTHGHITINVSGGTIGAVDDEGKLLGSQFSIGDVFGGCKGTTNGEYSNALKYDEYNNPVATAQTRLGISKSAIINLLNGTVNGSIYGGGEVGNVGERGLLDTEDKAFAKVNLLGGSVRNVYGGGLGMKNGYQGATEDAEALVKCDVKVNLNGLENNDYTSAHSSYVGEKREDNSYLATDGCVVFGTVFGCNNINGTPLGHAKVHVFKTVPQKTNPEETDYDVAAVYGGGNQADYKPTDTQQSTEVIIEGCDLSKIEYVYGGGNAAASPATSVLIMGTKHIKYIFGGGNGDGDNNPGANVGYYTGGTDTYTGLTKEQCKALVYLMAGNVDYIYGGSNSKGDIWGGSFVTNIDNTKGPGCCDALIYKDIYGGGKDADMSGPANIVFTCTNSTSWGNDIYPGAENANIGGDVTLTITSGKFKRVFGGNKYTGKIHGSITINIEENGECDVPVVIGEIYGGGNLAPYSVYGYDSNGTMLTSGTQQYADPQINIRAFTSIGNIYGGGLGDRAIMYGSPTVNINEVMVDDGGKPYGIDNEGKEVGETVTLSDDSQVFLYPHVKNKMGVIGNVFGGGNAAKVEGNTTVNVGTTEYEYLLVTDELTVGTTNVSGYYTRTNTGTAVNPVFTYEEASGTAVAETNYYKRNAVVGADIRGNVYGGGNEAEVTGNTNVNIGRDATTTTNTTTP